MNKLFLSLFVAHFTILGYSQSDKMQNVILMQGEVYKSPGMKLGELIVGYEGNLLNVKIEKDDIVIRIFEPQYLKIMCETRHAIPGGYSKHFFIEEFVIWNKECYLFYSIYDKENVIESLHYVKINQRTGGYINNPKKIFDVKGKVVSNCGYDKFIFSYSYDSSNLLIYYRPYPLERDREKIVDNYVFNLFSKEMGLNWAAEVCLPYEREKTDVNKIMISESGEIFILCTVFKDDKNVMKMQNGKPNFNLVMLKLDDSKMGFIKIPIEINKKLFTSISCKEIKNGDIVIGGLYSNNSYYDTDGVYGITIDVSTKTVRSEFNDYPAEFVTIYNDKIRKKRKPTKANIYNHSERYTKILDDGSIVCIGEQCYKEHLASRGTQSYNNYYYEDITICRLNPDNKIEWLKKLPKRQLGYNQNVGSRSLGFVSFNDDRNYYFVFSDSENNNKTIDEIPQVYKMSKDGIISMYVVNSTNGTIRRENITKLKEMPETFLEDFLKSKIINLKGNGFVTMERVSKRELALRKIEILSNN